MSRIFVATLGFDERSIIRSLIRYNTFNPEEDSLLIIVPKNGLEDVRIKKAYEAILSVLRYSTENDKVIDINVIEVNVPVEKNSFENFMRSLVNIVKSIVSKKYEKYSSEIIFNVSGGMRVLVLLAILAAKIIHSKFPGLKIILEMETEDRGMYVRIPIGLTDVSVSPRELTILEVIKDLRSASAKSVVERLGIPRTTFYYMIKGLIKRGFVAYKNGKYEITDLGLIALELSEIM